MGLEIGGAETHVIELSKALVSMGHEVTVASNGGVYVAELDSVGIPHVKLPLHTKNPFAVIRSYISLKTLIKKEQFDIVHAHARIPAFICGLLHKKLHFRFITSAHWVFKVNPLWRAVANWGERCVAVSDDIKQYVIDNYGFCADNVSVTINGIDTERFSENVDFSDIEKEFSLKKGAKRIVYVSRMDTSRSAVAALLCEIAPKLKECFPDTEIVIVGGGDDLARIASMADTANKTVGEKFIHITGGRTDINKFIAAGDIFVGVSRAALEAMSASKPTVVAGNEGYIGIFSPEKLGVAIDTNFCCRGCEESSTELLLRDLTELLSASGEKLRELGEYNKKTVLGNYSVKRMANDYVDAYKKLAPYKHYKKGDIVISGYYGYGNTGDDSLLLSIIENLRSADPLAKITVITKNPKKMEVRFGVRCISRIDLPSIISELKSAKLLLMGGGSILQNSSSNRSLFYYTEIIKLAKRLGTKIMLYSNGIGPLIGEKSKLRAAEAINSVDKLTLREPSSLEELKLLGANTSNASISADPALLLSPADDGRIKYIFDKNGIEKDNKYFAVSVREWKKLRNLSNGTGEISFEQTLADAINEISKKTDATPIFIPMQPSRDTEICKRIRALCTPDSIMLTGLTAHELIGVVGHTEFVIGMRLHMLIYATSAGVPVLGISYDPKIDAFLEYSGQPKALDVRSITSSEILSALTDIINDHDNIKTEIEAKCEKLKVLAKLDANTAIDLSGK